jgi:hypothetical protein
MNYSRTMQDGSARDEALKRLNGAVREALGMGPKPAPAPETEQHTEQKVYKKPSDFPAGVFPT